MNDQIKIEIGDFPEGFKKEVNEYIRFFSVILLLSDENNSYTIPASGTLCKIGEHYGIITARHVWDDTESGIQQHKEIKIIIGDGAYQVKVESLAAIGPDAEGTFNDAKVPDITFIRIPSEFSSTIEAHKKAFYSLDKRIQDHEGDLFGEDGYWSTFGSPVERLDAEIGKASSTVYGTSIPVKHNENDWEYLELEIIAEEGKMPENAKGMSGGGIWRTKWSADKNLKEFCIIDIILSGVNFYQTNRGSKYKIIGHGPKLIYENLYNLVINN